MNTIPRFNRVVCLISADAKLTATRDPIRPEYWRFDGAETGDHNLTTADPARLMAHWQGYTETAGTRPGLVVHNAPSSEAQKCDEARAYHLGQEVVIRCRQNPTAVVVGYAEHAGYNGLVVRLTNPPAWYVKQNEGNPLSWNTPHELEATA